VVEVWSSIPESVRSALITYELGRPFATLPASTCTTISDTMDNSYSNKTKKSPSSTFSEETLGEFYEKCPITDAQVKTLIWCLKERFSMYKTLSYFSQLVFTWKDTIVGLLL